MIRIPPKSGGWLEVVCGPMFSGKSEEMIRRLRRAEIAGQRAVIFKPRIDDRYDAADVVSHAGIRMRAVPVSDVAELVERARGMEVVGIDEVLPPLRRPGHDHATARRRPRSPLFRGDDRRRSERAVRGALPRLPRGRGRHRHHRRLNQPLGAVTFAACVTYNPGDEPRRTRRLPRDAGDPRRRGARRHE